jgi:uncharacterized lipoprotein YehR (DUF1307 family)
MISGKKRIAMLSCAVLMALSLLMAGCAKKTTAETLDADVDQEASSRFRVGYATEGVTAVEDPKAFNEAIDEAYREMMDSRIGLEYKNDAYSENGIDFSCYIANAESNLYDMFIAIYSDFDFSDELYLSQLLRPGMAFESVTLNHSLPEGSNTVYVVFSQVEEIDGEQSIHGQMAVTMNFVVES